MIIRNSFNYLEEKKDWYELEIGERAYFSGNRTEWIIRVPGGWVHCSQWTTGAGIVYSSECFIPYVVEEE